MQKIKGLLLALLFALPLVAAVHINEIMYNPVGDDNNNEFVEISGANNLSGYTVGDLAGNDSLVLVKFMLGNFSLIAEEGFNHTNINCTIYSAGATIGNNLNNAEDTIFLYYNNTLVDFMGYDGSLANSNDYSIELINGTWQESCEIGGSPGGENCKVIDESVNATINDTVNETTNQSVNTTINATPEENITKENNTKTGLKLEIVIPETLYLGMMYTSLFKITNLDHVSGIEDNIFLMVRYNVTRNNTLVKEDYFNKTINYYSSSNTGRLFFEEAGIYTLCGFIVNSSISMCRDFAVINPLSIPCSIKLNLSTDKEMYLNKEKVKIKNIINNKSFPYIIEYWVEDLFGNEVKKKYNTSNTNQKTYTPKIVEKDRVFLVKNRLVFVACNNSNSELGNEKMIIIKKDEISIGIDDDSDSGLSIDYVYLPKSKIFSFGDSFNVKLSIHKGNTAKSVVNVFVEKDKKKVSEKTTFYLNKKNYDYNLTVKVFLKPNCKNAFNDGYYALVVEGLGKRAEEGIEIKGNKKGVCKEENIEESGEISSFYTQSKKYKQRINLYANIKGKGVYKAILQSRTGEQNKTIHLNSSEKVRFVVEVEPGKNIFILKLRKDDNVVDTKTLVVELEGEENKESLIEELLLEKNNKTNEELNSSVNYSLVPVTGGVVYESNNMRIVKYAPYLLSFVLTLVIVGLILSKRQ
ncbi:lamin tail domain-containing protein [Candidatus Woesearchaeota archaeon]|nr:lamin tail domain-containing protein [Candidatus Woesearchaeota archaeon]